jgi:hypothetical protein
VWVSGNMSVGRGYEYTYVPDGVSVARAKVARRGRRIVQRMMDRRRRDDFNLFQELCN